ncbi:MAG: type IV pilus assembly protein PilM [Thermoleophilia bacterium]
MALFGGKQSVIGLDIGKSSIVGVQLVGRPPSVAIKAFHEQPLPEGVVFEGEVIDVESLAAELKKFMRSSNMKGGLVHLGVGNQKVIVRHIEVPEMGEEELRGAIEFQAQDYIPIPVDEAVLDFQVVARYTDEDGIAKQQVLLVAAQKEMVQRFLDAAKKAGVKVAGIDVSAFALVRALSAPVSFVDQGAEAGQTLGVVNISSSVSTLVVARDGVPKFTRIINFAHDNLVGSLVEKQGVPPEDAEVLCQRIGLPGPLPADSETYNPVTIQEVHESLAGAAEELADELRRSLDYYQTQDYAAYVDELVLTGRGALVRNLDAFLSEYLNMQVVLGNPLLKIAENRTGIPDEVLAAVAPRLAVAVGLALDEVD